MLGITRVITISVILLSLYLGHDLALASETFPFEDLPIELKEKVINQVVVDRIVNAQSLTDVALVHTEWRALVNNSVKP